MQSDTKRTRYLVFTMTTCKGERSFFLNFFIGGVTAEQWLQPTIHLFYYLHTHTHTKAFILHVVEQHSDRSTQRHVVYDLFAANVLVPLVLHEDGQILLGVPGHFLGLGGQDTGAAHLLLEEELFTPGQHGQDVVGVTGLGREEGVDLQGLLRDVHPDVPFAVVAHLACAVHVPHVAPADTTGLTGRDSRSHWTF